MSLQKAPVIQAAGGVLWRYPRETGAGAGSDVAPEVAMVHRPRYDDWSLPKGKRKTGEELLLTGVREVTEETGHLVEVGPYLGQYSYEVTSSGRPAIKTVKYWSMLDVGGGFEPNDEVDVLEWVSVAEATERTRFPTDRKVLEAFLKLPRPASLLLVVRNGSAVRASRRVSPDRRGLDRRGKQQAEALVPVLGTLSIDTVVSTTARRCVDTLQPYARQRDVDVEIDDNLGAATQSSRRMTAATARLLGHLGAGKRVAVCAEGALADRLVTALGSALTAGEALDNGPLTTARQRRSPGIKKGSWCLLHVGAGELLSIERQDAA